jgi:tetratricopeptide (TPR) repeat protein
MAATQRVVVPGLGAVVFVLFALAAPLRGQEAGKEASLQDAIKARTDVTVLMQEVAELDAAVRRAMRRVIAQAEGQQMAGNILLMKDKYAEAVEAYEKAAALYRQALARISHHFSVAPAPRAARC